MLDIIEDIKEESKREESAFPVFSFSFLFLFLFLTWLIWYLIRIFWRIYNENSERYDKKLETIISKFENIGNFIKPPLTFLSNSFTQAFKSINELNIKLSNFLK